MPPAEMFPVLEDDEKRFTVSMKEAYGVVFAAVRTLVSQPDA